MGSSEEEQGDHPIRLPATDDPPRGYHGASWWPITIALGVAGFVVGVGTFIVGSRVRAIADPGWGIAVSLFGLLLAFVGLATWMHRGFIADYREGKPSSNVEKYLWGMLLYMPAELAVFGAGILYFAFIYYGSWPPGDLPAMLPPRVWIMTAFIVTSMFTNYFASRALNDGNERRFVAFLAATPILGVLFLVGKVTNFYRLVVVEGYTIGSDLYWTAFFSMSGLHGVLVVIGVVFMLVVLGRALAGHYSPEQHTSVTTANMYWWMVDSIWLVLLVELYGTVALCRAAGTC